MYWLSEYSVIHGLIIFCTTTLVLEHWNPRPLGHISKLFVQNISNSYLYSVALGNSLALMTPVKCYNMVNCYDFNVKHKLYHNPGVLRSLKVAEYHLGDWITNAMTDLGSTKSLTHVYRGTL